MTKFFQDHFYELDYEGDSKIDIKDVAKYRDKIGHRSIQDKDNFWRVNRELIDIIEEEEGAFPNG